MRQDAMNFSFKSDDLVCRRRLSFCSCSFNKYNNYLKELFLSTFQDADCFILASEDDGLPASAKQLCVFTSCHTNLKPILLSVMLVVGRTNVNFSECCFVSTSSCFFCCFVDIILVFRHFEFFLILYCIHSPLLPWASLPDCTHLLTSISSLLRLLGTSVTFYSFSCSLSYITL